MTYVAYVVVRQPARREAGAGGGGLGDPVHPEGAPVAAVRPWSTGGQLVNFLFGANATPDRVRAAYEPDTYRRLVGLKAEYDPANLFRHNHNIPPG